MFRVLIIFCFSVGIIWGIPGDGGNNNFRNKRNSAVQCGVSVGVENEVGDRIEGGDKVQRGQFPWCVVFLIIF